MGFIELHNDKIIPTENIDNISYEEHENIGSIYIDIGIRSYCYYTGDIETAKKYYDLLKNQLNVIRFRKDL